MDRFFTMAYDEEVQKENEYAKKRKNLETNVKILEKSIKQEPHGLLENRVTRPISVIATHVQNEAINEHRSFSKKQEKKLTSALVNERPQLYSPRKSQPGGFEKTEMQLIKQFIGKKSTNKEDISKFCSSLCETVGTQKMTESLEELLNTTIVNDIVIEMALVQDQASHKLNQSITDEKNKMLDEFGHMKLDEIESEIKKFENYLKYEKEATRPIAGKHMDPQTAEILVDLAFGTWKKEVLEEMQSNSFKETNEEEGLNEPKTLYENEIQARADNISDVERTIRELKRSPAKFDHYISELNEMQKRAAGDIEKYSAQFSQWQTNLDDLWHTVAKIRPEVIDKFDYLTNSHNLLSVLNLENTDEKKVSQNEFRYVKNGQISQQIQQLHTVQRENAKQLLKINRQIIDQRKEIQKEIEIYQREDWLDNWELVSSIVSRNNLSFELSEQNDNEELAQSILE